MCLGHGHALCRFDHPSGLSRNDLARSLSAQGRGFGFEPRGQSFRTPTRQRLHHLRDGWKWPEIFAQRISGVPVLTIPVQSKDLPLLLPTIHRARWVLLAKPSQISDLSGSGPLRSGKHPFARLSLHHGSLNVERPRHHIAHQKTKQFPLNGTLPLAAHGDDSWYETLDILLDLVWVNPRGELPYHLIQVDDLDLQVQQGTSIMSNKWGE